MTTQRQDEAAKALRTLEPGDDVELTLESGAVIRGVVDEIDESVVTLGDPNDSAILVEASDVTDVVQMISSEGPE